MALVGIPAIVAGIFELLRRPNLVIGFEPELGYKAKASEWPALSSTVRLTLKQDNPGFSDARIRFVVMNRGRATARDVVINFIWPGDDDWKSYHPESEDPASRYYRDHRIGAPVSLAERPYLHPKDYYFDDFTIAVRSNMKALDIPYTVSMSNRRQSGNLSVTLTS